MRDLDSPYLLSGLARCAHCGGPMESLGQDYSRRKGRFYGCAYHRKRGTAICKNSLRVEQARLDQVLLEAIGAALDDRILEAAVEEAFHRLGTGKTQCDRRKRIERELSVVEAHQRNLAEAIAHGEALEPLLGKLKEEEQRKEQLMGMLADLTAAPVIELDGARMKRQLRAKVADVRALLGRHISQARQVLKKLIQNPLMCEAYENVGERGYRVTGQGSYLPLLPAPIASPFVASPRGRARFCIHTVHRYCKGGMNDHMGTRHGGLPLPSFMLMRSAEQRGSFTAGLAIIQPQPASKCDAIPSPVRDAPPM
jgi:hypothetical protein